jgi:flagellar hook assembly protein FlgD
VTPNPARGSSTLLFQTEAARPVTIRLFDARGRLVRRIESSQAAGVGYHEAVLDARDPRGSLLPTGTYFYRIDAPEGRTTGRWIVVR